VTLFYASREVQLRRFLWALAGPGRLALSLKERKEGASFTVAASDRRRINALPVDHFPSGVLVQFPSGVPSDLDSE
jgi:hypothetical protein